jgi:dephospho-CoA kinase
MFIIGLSGKAGSGKDTAANFILKYYASHHPNKKVQTQSFSLKLKQMVATLTGTSLEQNMSREGKAMVIPHFNKSLGELQQLVGTELRHTLGADVWVHALLSNEQIYTNDVSVVTDVRFVNEKNAIEERDGVVIRINRNNFELKDGRDPNHESETALDNASFDYTISNDGSLEEFERGIMSMIHRISKN